MDMTAPERHESKSVPAQSPLGMLALETLPDGWMVSFTFTPRGTSPELPFSATKQDFTPLLLLIIVSMTTMETPCTAD